jgi:tetratricopeptide (TPR) repeat protein
MFIEPEIGSFEEQITSREAYLVYLEQGPEAALAILAGKTDPDSVARHLKILLQQNRFQEARDLVRGLEPSVKWTNLAAYAFAKAGEFEEAERILSRTKEVADRVFQQRTAVGFGHGCLEFIVQRSGRQGSIPFSALKEDDLAVIRRLLVALTNAFSFEAIRSPLAEHAACLALNAYASLKDEESLRLVASALTKRSPLPLPLADAVLAKVIPLPDGFVTRLRSEHPKSFQARLKAALIEGLIQGRPGPALSSAMAMREMSLDAAQRAELANAMYALAAPLGPGTIDLVDTLLPDLLRQEDPQFKLFSVDQYLRRGDLDAAESLIQGAEGSPDPSWTQAAALLREKRGDVDGALALLQEVSTTTVSLGLLLHAASLAHQHGRLGLAISFLERAVEVVPGDRDARQNLALVYGQAGDFAKAAEHYRVLLDASPGEVAVAVRLAASLALSDRLEQSLSIYEDVCRLDSAPLSAHLGKARILWALNRPKEGFAALEALQARFQDEPTFLLSFLSAAHAAGHDDVTPAILRRLADLQKQEGIGEPYLQGKSLEDLKAFMLQQNELREIFAERTLRGQIPWLLADSQTCRVPYLGWAVRTHAADWIPEDPFLWAASTVYATNNYTVAQKKDQPLLVPVVAAAKSSAVVADMSSLITLHALGLLERVAERFQEFLIPAVYFPRVLDERANILPHQLSRRAAATALKRAVDGQLIGVVEEVQEQEHQEPIRVAEYTLDGEESSPVYRMVDLKLALHDGGHLSEAQLLEFDSIIHTPSPAPATLPALQLGAIILVQLDTLQALAATDLLGPVLTGFRVLVTVSDRREIERSETNYQFQEKVAAWHSDMWKRLGDTSKFKRVPVEVPADWKQQEGDDPGRDLSLAATMIALHRKIPLLVDDRMCQALVLNQEPSHEDAAFGTAHVVESMMEGGELDVGNGTAAFLRLMRWRYRFILPPVNVLVECAHQYRQRPPGMLLCEIAAYAHDSMRDPGLFNGPEKSTPPTPMGVRLFNAWCQLTGEFVLAVWSDNRFGEDAALKLTRWAVDQLLPSLPVGNFPNWQIICAELARRSAMDGALFRCLSLEPSDRTRAGFKALGEALGFSEEEYRRTVTEIINGL